MLSGFILTAKRCYVLTLPRNLPFPFYYRKGQQGNSHLQCVMSPVLKCAQHRWIKGIKKCAQTISPPKSLAEASCSTRGHTGTQCPRQTYPCLQITNTPSEPAQFFFKSSPPPSHHMLTHNSSRSPLFTADHAHTQNPGGHTGHQNPVKARCQIKGHASQQNHSPLRP